MKRLNIGVVLLLLACTLSACSMGAYNYKPQNNSIFIAKDGSVKSSVVEASAKDIYTADALKTFAQTEVDAYLASASDAGSITVDSTGVNDGNIYIVFAYSNPASLVDFASFSQDEEMNISTLSTQASNAGVTTSVNGTTTVYTEGKISEVTGAATKVDDHTAQVSGEATITSK